LLQNLEYTYIQLIDIDSSRTLFLNDTAL